MKNLLKTHGLDISMLIGTICAIAVASFISFAQECEKLPLGILRLHIIAESNSEQDQQLKYELRDYILDEFASRLQDSDCLEAVLAKSHELLPEIREKSLEFTNMAVSAEITTMYFPTRRYDTGTLPAGNYTALRLVIGEGNGENWWCVMFPALCLPAVSETNTVPALNVPETVTDSPRVRFAVFEFLSGLIR